MGAARVVGPAGEAKYGSAAAAMNGGDCVVVGNRVGVVMGLKPIAIGDPYALNFDGVIDLDAKSDDTWSDGDLLYWDATALHLTDTAGANKTAGIAVGDKANAAIRASVDLNASVGSTTV